MGASTMPASRATKLIRDAERRGDVLVVEVIRFLRIVLLDASGPSGWITTSCWSTHFDREFG